MTIKSNKITDVDVFVLFEFFKCPHRHENAPLKFKVCHGPVSSKQDIRGIGLHAFSVALGSCLVLSLFKVSVALQKHQRANLLLIKTNCQFAK